MKTQAIKKKKSLRGIKTIDLNVKEWWDRTYGNTYFSGQIVLNYGMKSERVIYLPFQYGYGSHSESMALAAIAREYVLPENVEALWHLRYYCGIVLRINNEKGCKKRDVEAFGEED